MKTSSENGRRCENDGELEGAVIFCAFEDSIEQREVARETLGIFGLPPNTMPGFYDRPSDLPTVGT
jgi:hypothetical protein